MVFPQMVYLHYWTRTLIPIQVQISIPKMDTVMIGHLDQDWNPESESMQMEQLLYNVAIGIGVRIRVGI